MDAFITGASQGLGKAFATYLAEKGLNLHLVARSAEKLSVLKNELTVHGVTINCYATDLGKEDEVYRLCEKLIANETCVDLLINNVGQYDMDTVSSLKMNNLRQLTQVNAFAAIEITQALSRQMKNNKRGHIINIGSIVSKTPRADAAAYSISKFAFHGFTQVLREELRPFKIKVTEVIPGSINTSSWDGIDNVPKEEFIQPQQIVDAVWNTYQNTGLSNIEELVLRPLNPDF